MKKLFVAIGICALVCLGNIHASRTEKINFKGGVVVEGHITSQKLGESITFSVERTNANINSKWIASRRDAGRTYNELPSVWKDWIKESGKESVYQNSNNKFAMQSIRLYDNAKLKSFKMNQGDSITAKVLSTIFNGESHVVHILEDGAIIGFLDQSPSTCVFNWSDIRSVEYVERESNALNGIIDVVEAKSGVYKGQIIEKILDDRIRLKTSEGMIRNILNEDIISLKKERLNPNVSILKQTQYFDEVNGTVGLIVSQQMKQNPPYIIILDEKDCERQINMEKIRTIKSVKNKNYESLTDIIIKGDEAYFNKVEIPSVICKNKKGLFTLGKDSVERIKELHIDSDESHLEVLMANNDLNKTAILLPVNKEMDGKDVILSFSYEDVLQKAIASKSQDVSINNTLHLEYTVSHGYYVLYIPKAEKFFFCKIN